MMDFTQHYIISRDGKTLFIPWAFLLTLGGCWTVCMPSDANRTSLTKMLRWLHVSSIAISLCGVVLAKLFGLSVVHLLIVSCLFVVMIYTLAIIPLISPWRRLPFSRAVEYMYDAGQDGSVLLLSQLFLGLLATAMVLLFHSGGFFVIAFCAILLANSILAAIVLFRRSRVSR